jgi:hypothetical protein
MLTDEGGEVTSPGERFLSEFGVDLKPRTRRMFCQPCWGLPNSPGHYLDFVSAVLGCALLLLGFLGNRIARKNSNPFE